MPAVKKTTYSLDAATLTKLRKLAQRWQVSKTEVLRRALTKAAEADMPPVEERLTALRQLQRRLKERGVDFEKWKRDIKDARR